MRTARHREGNQKMRERIKTKNNLNICVRAINDKTYVVQKPINSVIQSLSFIFVHII